MKGKSIEYDVTKFSAIEEIPSRIISAIASYFEYFQAEQAQVISQQIKKRKMQSGYLQDLIDGLPLEERLKMSNFRT